MADSKSLLTYETWVHAVAGAAGSIVAMSVFYPLDTVRFRLQLEDAELKKKGTLQAIFHILREEGLDGLYRGLKPVLLSLGASNFVYFYSFHGLKSFFHTSTAESDLLLGVIAGAINVFATTPLWVVNNRLKFLKPDTFNGLLDGLVHIGSKEGLASLWAGTSSSLILVSNPAIQFAIYEALKRRVDAKSAGTFFMLGAVSKAIATVLTYPLQLAQAKQRSGKVVQNGTAALLLSILKKNGATGLFDGLEAKLMQTVLTTALMFMTYEKIVRFVFLLLLRKAK